VRGQVVAAQRPLGQVGERVRAALPGRPAVDVALPAGESLDRRQDRLGVARGPVRFSV
jgi:hypothetical protein